MIGVYVAHWLINQVFQAQIIWISTMKFCGSFQLMSCYSCSQKRRSFVVLISNFRSGITCIFCTSLCFSEVLFEVFRSLFKYLSIFNNTSYAGLSYLANCCNIISFEYVLTFVMWLVDWLLTCLQFYLSNKYTFKHNNCVSLPISR